MEPNTENLDALFDECIQTGINPFGSGPVPIGPRVVSSPDTEANMRPGTALATRVAHRGDREEMETR